MRDFELCGETSCYWDLDIDIFSYMYVKIKVVYGVCERVFARKLSIRGDEGIIWLM